MATRGDSDRREHWTRNRLLVWGVGGAMLLLPPLAMELMDEAAGDPGDFVFGAVLLLVMGLAYEGARLAPTARAYPVAVLIATVAALLQLWINLAVGIVGSEDHPANWLYVGVVGVAVLGGTIARLRPAPMAYAMTAAALAQGLVFLVVLVSGLGFTGPTTVFFAALWLTAAWLFARAGKASAAPRS